MFEKFGRVPAAVPGCGGCVERVCICFAHPVTVLLLIHLQIEKIYVVKMGEIVLTSPDGKVVIDPAFVKEAGGFTFFGDSCLEAITRCPYTVSCTIRVVSGQICHVCGCFGLIACTWTTHLLPESAGQSMADTPTSKVASSSDYH